MQKQGEGNCTDFKIKDHFAPSQKNEKQLVFKRTTMSAGRKRKTNILQRPTEAEKGCMISQLEDTDVLLPCEQHNNNNISSTNLSCEKKLKGCTPKTAMHRCGKCVGCVKSDCGTCVNCKDKKKFGGPGKRKQACKNKKCINMSGKKAQNEPSDKAKKHPLKDHSKSIDDHQSLTAFLSSYDRERRHTVGDGNCLFRSLSYNLFNTEDYHYELRSLLQRFENKP